MEGIKYSESVRELLNALQVAFPVGDVPCLSEEVPLAMEIRDFLEVCPHCEWQELSSESCLKTLDCLYDAFGEEALLYYIPAYVRAYLTFLLRGEDSDASLLVGPLLNTLGRLPSPGQACAEPYTKLQCVIFAKLIHILRTEDAKDGSMYWEADLYDSSIAYWELAAELKEGLS